MLMPYARVILFVLASMALGTIACAQRESAAADVDPGQRNERYGIEPGTEELFAAMLGSGETLAGGCKLDDGQIERTVVVAKYTCTDGAVVLQLDHPDLAPADAIRTQRFAITVKSGTPPAGFVDGVAERVRTREEGFHWKALGGTSPRRNWAVPAFAAAAVAIVVIWAVRRLARRRGA
jgi:hypothetical protein